MTLERVLAEIVALRPGNPAVANLALDCWVHAAEHGEAAGLIMADNLRAGVLRYAGHERALQGLTGPATGVVLGERPVPFLQAVWLILGRRLKRRVKPGMVFLDVGKTIPGDEDLVVMWCGKGDKGWWRVPIQTQE